MVLYSPYYYEPRYCWSSVSFIIVIFYPCLAFNSLSSLSLSFFLVYASSLRFCNAFHWSYSCVKQKCRNNNEVIWYPIYFFLNLMIPKIIFFLAENDLPGFALATWFRIIYFDYTLGLLKHTNAQLKPKNI